MLRFLFSVIFAFTTSVSLAQESSLNLPEVKLLQSIDLDKYIKKELYTLLLNDTIKRSYDSVYYWFGCDSKNKDQSLCGIIINKKITFDTEIIIKIHIKKFKHQKKVSLNHEWDFELLLKEKIAWLSIQVCSSYCIPIKEAGKLKVN